MEHNTRHGKTKASVRNNKARGRAKTFRFWDLIYTENARGTTLHNLELSLRLWVI